MSDHVGIGEDEVGPCLVVKRSLTLEERNATATRELWDLQPKFLTELEFLIDGADLGEFIKAIRFRPAVRKWLRQLAKLKLDELLGDPGDEATK